MKSAGKVFRRWGEPGAITTENKKAGETPAVQKKCPGLWPGRSFLQKEVYQTHNPLVKTKVSMEARRAGTPINQIPSGVSTLPSAKTSNHTDPVLVMYIRRALKFPLLFSLLGFTVAPRTSRAQTCDCLCEYRSFLRREEKGPWS